MKFSSSFLRLGRQLSFFSLTLMFIQCSASRNIQNTDVVATAEVSYTNDIRPIMIRSCTPCHFPEFGKAKMLNNSKFTQRSFDDILRRVQLPEDHDEFMPFEKKRPALTTEEIDLLKKWQSLGFPE